MSIVQPGATDTTLSKNHAQLHCIVAVDSSAPNESIVVGSTGNVGIGTASPTGKLDVNGNILVEGYNYLYFTSGNNAIYSPDGNSLSLYTNGANILHLSTDVYTNAWADYSASSTIVGWTSISSKSIYTKKVGKTVFVQFSIGGTSNSTSTTFTLPYTKSSDISQIFMFLATDNSQSSIVAYGAVGSNSATVTLNKDTAGDAWTASGTKSIYGQFWYQAQ